MYSICISWSTVSFSSMSLQEIGHKPTVPVPYCPTRIQYLKRDVGMKLCHITMVHALCTLERCWALNEYLWNSNNESTTMIIWVYIFLGQFNSVIMQKFLISNKAPCATRSSWLCFRVVQKRFVLCASGLFMEVILKLKFWTYIITKDTSKCEPTYF